MKASWITCIRLHVPESSPVTTNPVYYESRIAKLALNAAELPKLDAEFEEIIEGEELTKEEKLKNKWMALEALVGAHYKALVAFTDVVKDAKDAKDGQEYTEVKMDGFPEAATGDGEKYKG